MAKSNSKKKNHLLLLLIVLLIAISVGYAAFAQTLFINGTATANGNFKLKFTNAVINPNVGATGSSASISASGDTLTIDMQLQYPGAGGKVTATIENSGDVPAKLNTVRFTGNADPDISIDLEDAIEGEDILPGATKDIVITVKWNEDSVVSSKSVRFTAELDYVQSTTNFEQTVTNTNNNV